MSIQKINPVTPQNNSHKASFGHVIPVSIKLDGKMMEQSLENIDFFKSIAYRFSIGMGKGKGIFADMAKKFSAVDKEFDGQLRSIRGSGRRLWGIRRFFVTGGDIYEMNYAGKQIGRTNSRSAYSDKEYSMRTDASNFIKGIKAFVIDVKSRIVNKKNGATETVYDIIGGDFMKEPPKKPVQPAAAVKKVVKAPEPQPLTESQTKLATANKRIKKKAKYNPNQQLLPFVTEVEKAQEAKETREAVAKLWANH